MAPLVLEGERGPSWRGGGEREGDRGELER